MPVEISDNLRAPDFLAFAKYSNRIVPVLIECKATNDNKIVWFGLTVEGGVIWHDLRRTFATELRGRQVHEYDISDLLGHTIQSVTGTYARSTPEALEHAVNRLTEPRGTVVQFKGRLVKKLSPS